MRERRWVLKGKRWIRVEDFEPGPMVFRNDTALEFSREVRKRPVRWHIMFEIIVNAAIVLMFSSFLEGTMLAIFTAIFVIVTLLLILIKWRELKNIDRVDLLPRVHQTAVVCSYVSYYANEVVMMPYDQLEDIIRYKDHVLLKTRSRRKFGFKYGELGDEGFLALMNVFLTAKGADYPVDHGGHPVPS